MKQEWQDYLSKIGVADKLFEIIEKKISDVELIFNDKIDRIFVSNNQENQQIAYTSLWLFSDRKVYECKNFISKDDYDVLVFKERVAYVNIQKSDYTDLHTPTQDSILNVICYLTNANLSCSLNAVGINVKYLLGLLQDVYLANIK